MHEKGSKARSKAKYSVACPCGVCVSVACPCGVCVRLGGWSRRAWCVWSVCCVTVRIPRTPYRVRTNVRTAISRPAVRTTVRVPRARGVRTCTCTAYVIFSVNSSVRRYGRARARRAVYTLASRPPRCSSLAPLSRALRRAVVVDRLAAAVRLRLRGPAGGAALLPPHSAGSLFRSWVRNFYRFTRISPQGATFTVPFYAHFLPVTFTVLPQTLDRKHTIFPSATACCACRRQPHLCEPV